MSNARVSRRNFLQTAGTLAGSSMLRLSAPALFAAAQAACSAKEQAAAFKTLTTSEALELDAIAARILPSTATPGAREAGVIYFMDNVLGNELSSMLPGIRGMLGGFQAGIVERFADAEVFSELSEADQDAWLGGQEETQFFFLVRLLTLMGFFAMSSYGGNKDHLGWDLIGFAGHAATQPPFGYYDAEYQEDERNGR